MMTTNLSAGIEMLHATNPITRQQLPGEFVVATPEEVDQAAAAAHSAWLTFRQASGLEKAAFLRTIASEIEALGEVLVDRAVAESGLPAGRITGERGRTCGQLRKFADLVEEGSWVGAIIDEAQPERQPFPRSDLRKMLVPIGPVAVFTASNFPLAFSTAGGDTAAALAAGCPVVVKAHPSHLGTNALVAGAIHKAAEKCGLPAGVFSSVQGGNATGKALVLHPQIKAVGFTGSHRGGMALTELANSRPEPIPVYAEMGSNNPIFLLPEKLKASAETLATTIAGSVNLGAGQFCTNPGILVMQQSAEADRFLAAFAAAMADLSAATMLNEGIFRAYGNGVSAVADVPGVNLGFQANIAPENWDAAPAFAQTSAQNFLKTPALQQEVFGPFTLIVMCEDGMEMQVVAEGLAGQLTATMMGTTEELAQAGELLNALTEKAGRVICNGVPTGVEVCAAMHHGGPYPATTNALFTSVGTEAIKRFARPVTFQDLPDGLLPPALQAGNPLGISRTVNGQMTS
ncbi:MAG: aldehyde dehydrogenase (NADP(+)) [Lewinella sp.]